MDLSFSGFEWDAGNQNKNLIKHGITCQEAEEAFLQEPHFVYPDDRHSTEMERRFILLGETKFQRPLFIAFTLKNDKIRIISARPMSQKERTWYAEEKRKNNS